MSARKARRRLETGHTIPPMRSNEIKARIEGSVRREERMIRLVGEVAARAPEAYKRMTR